MEELGLVYPPNKPFDRVIVRSTAPTLYDQLMFLYCGSTGLLRCNNIVAILKL